MRSRGWSVVSDREAQTLQHLWRLRFLTTAQLGALLFAGSSATARSQIVMTQRVLGALKRRGLVVALPPVAGGTAGRVGSPCYCLTREGLQVGRRLWPGNSPTQLRSTGTLLARHALATADTILAFQRAAVANVDHELVSWECDWQAALPLGSSVVEPDGYILYRAGRRRLHAFLEIDLSSEHARSIALKVRRYFEAHRAGDWRIRFPVWPAILMIAETNARLLQLRRTAEAVSRLPGGSWDIGASFYFATLAAVLSPEGPLGAIWFTLGESEQVALLPAVVVPGTASDSRIDSMPPAAPSEMETTDGSNLTNQTGHGA